MASQYQQGRLIMFESIYLFSVLTEELVIEVPLSLILCEDYADAWRQPTSQSTLRPLLRCCALPESIAPDPDNPSTIGAARPAAQMSELGVSVRSSHRGDRRL